MDPEIEIRELRRLLFLRHGCPSECLYGDDGEMQCGKCVIDFKRDSVQKIEIIFYKNGIKKLKEERGD